MKKLLTFVFLVQSFLISGQTTNYQMLVGTYTNGQSKGIYSLNIDKQGKIISQKLVATTDNPSFLAFSPDKKFVYAVNESGSKSAVSAFRFDKKNDTLLFLNKIYIGDAGPCFVTVTKNHVFTSNYGNGTVSVLVRTPDGALTDVHQTIVHKGIPSADGKVGPTHVHETVFAPDSSFLIVNNLGEDRIYTYTYNPEAQLNILKEKGFTTVKHHSGPRHAVFSKNGEYLYLLQELNADLTVFKVKGNGKLHEIQATSVINDSVLNSASAAEIALSPDEKFLYATNRGKANDITCFKVNANGTLTKQQSYSTNGDSPRNFAISPDGNFIFVGNQNSNNITVFKRNKMTGALIPLRQNYQIGAPVCLLFY